MEDALAFDMDEARRARAEKQGEPKRFRFGGQVFDLPIELPFSFSEALLAGEWKTAVTVLLNGKVEEFFSVDPPLTNQDLEFFATQVSAIYTGAEPGESPASRSRSEATSKSSRPRSKRTTT